MLKSCKHRRAQSLAGQAARAGKSVARPDRMSISPPRQVAPYRGRDRDCEAAIMASFDDLIRNLLRSGMSEQEIVRQLEMAHDGSGRQSALADDMETVKEWAVHAGWEPSEVDRALLTLSDVFYARIRTREKEVK